LQQLRLWNLCKKCRKLLPKKYVWVFWPCAAARLSPHLKLILLQAVCQLSIGLMNKIRLFIGNIANKKQRSGGENRRCAV